MLDELVKLKNKILEHPLASSYIIKENIQNIAKKFATFIKVGDLHSALDCLIQLQNIYNSMEDLMSALGERNEISYEELIQEFDLVEEDNIYT